MIFRKYRYTNPEPPNFCSNLLNQIDNITVQFVNGKLHVGGTEKITWFFNKMQEQGGFKSQLTGITEGASTLTPNETSAKFLFFMFQSGGNFVSEVST